MNTPAVPEREIGRRRFGLADQLRFAQASRDHNPMHVDPVAARRLLTGQPVVHGMHVLIQALDFWAPRGTPLRLDCSFNNAVSAGDEVVFTEKSATPQQVLLQASVEGVVCANLRIALVAASTTTSVTPPVPGVAGDLASPDELAAPLEAPPTQHVGRRYRLAVRGAEATEAYPAACRLLGPARIGGLMTLSYFVGMVCPGLHSIFSSVSLDLPADDPAAGAIDFEVTQFDERFHLFTVRLSGALSGRLTAFQRPPPTPQAGLPEIAAQVAADEFAGTRSLVIGASRGLGELVAKILASGGGEVVLGYAQGRADSERLAAEISAGGRGQARIAQVDVTALAACTVDFDQLDAVYYFATPRIGRRKAGLFQRALFDEFIDFYAGRLEALCTRIERGSRMGKLRLYVPSSVYITDRPDGMTEYAMAKAAAEVLIADINRKFKKVDVIATRLPKLRTDQTASVVPERTADNLATLLPVVRQVSGRA